jgi:hypothetical protein
MTKTITINADKLGSIAKVMDKITGELVQKELEIKNAGIKDMQCSYGYELLTGKTKGDIIGRKGIHVVHDDLNNAFSNLDIFLAHIDDVFSSDDAVNNQTHLSTLEERDEVINYVVSAFKITGVEESKSVILSGTKTVAQGDITFSTPKIKLGGSYLYIEELELRLNSLIQEVEAYMDGKTAPQYEQSSMDFESFAEEDNSFEQGKVI